MLNNYGPLKVTFAHERHLDYQVAGKSDFGYRGLVSYDFGVVSVAAFVDRTTYQLANGNLSRNAGSLGVAIPAGPGAIKLNYAVAQDGKGSAPVGTKVGAYVLGDKTDATSWTLGYDWRLAKEFSVYGYVSQLKNRAQGAYDWDVNALGIGGSNRGMTASALVVGAKHEF